MPAATLKWRERISVLTLTLSEVEVREVLRKILVVDQGRIEKLFYPVFPPDKNADAVLGYLRGRLGGSGDRARS